MNITPVAGYGKEIANATPLFYYNAKTDVVTFRVDADPLVTRRKIEALKDRMLADTGNHTEMPVEHILLDGVYTRKLFIPKGTLIVGKIHLKQCVNIVAKGDISVMTETGSARLGAGFSVVSPPGLQKVGYAHEDTVFINVFRTDFTDIKEIEAEIAADTYAAFAALTLTKKGLLCQSVHPV